jgi:hypothetical protein
MGRTWESKHFACSATSGLFSPFGGVQELLSPFNFANWFVTALTLAPGIVALVWADKLAARRRLRG